MKNFLFAFSLRISLCSYMQLFDFFLEVLHWQWLLLFWGLLGSTGLFIFFFQRIIKLQFQVCLRFKAIIHGLYFAIELKIVMKYYDFLSFFRFNRTLFTVEISRAIGSRFSLRSLALQHVSMRSEHRLKYCIKNYQQARLFDPRQLYFA